MVSRHPFEFLEWIHTRLSSRIFACDVELVALAMSTARVQTTPRSRIESCTTGEGTPGIQSLQHQRVRLSRGPSEGEGRRRQRKVHDIQLKEPLDDALEIGSCDSATSKGMTGKTELGTEGRDLRRNLHFLFLPSLI